MNTSARYDLVVLGAGVVGCSIAFHAARLGAGRVLLLDRGGIAEGTTSQSSSILRTHYSVPENVELARRSYAAFADFAAYVDDPEATSGFTRCGYLIVAADDARGAAVRASLAQQRALGIAAAEIDAQQARELLPLLDTDGLAVFGHEPDAGYADAYLVASGFAKAARRLGVEIRTGVAATALLPEEIEKLLAPLDERERQILALRFGLDRGEPRTLEEVGEHFNLTRERIRQIEARAMSKLRHPSADTGARDLLAV